MTQIGAAVILAHLSQPDRPTEPVEDFGADPCDDNLACADCDKRNTAECAACDPCLTCVMDCEFAGPDT